MIFVYFHCYDKGFITVDPIYFGPRVYPMGPVVIALVRPLVRPSLNISETAHWFFLIFCMKLGHHKGTKVTEPDF